MRFPWNGRKETLPEPENDHTDTSMDVHQELREHRSAIEQLEADIDYLRLEVKRLRGTVTGSLKGKNSSEDAPVADHRQLPLIPGTPEWMAAENVKIRGR